MVYLLDYDGHYDIPTSSHTPLPQQFQVFPFQMLHCCFSDQFALTFGIEVCMYVCTCMHEQLVLSPLFFISPFPLSPPLYLSYVRQDGFWLTTRKTVTHLSQYSRLWHTTCSLAFGEAWISKILWACWCRCMCDGSCRGQLWTTEGEAMFALSDSLWLTVLSYQQQQCMKYRDIGILPFLCSTCMSSIHSLVKVQTAQSRSHEFDPQWCFYFPPFQLLLLLPTIPPYAVKNELVFNFPHSIYSGKEMGAYVTTDLSSKGTFWVQVEGRGQQTAMFQRLQDVAEGMRVFTAIFHPGNLVAAWFSEDNLWYRAQVESKQGEMVSDEGVVKWVSLMFPSLTVDSDVNGLWQCGRGEEFSSYATPIWV